MLEKEGKERQAEEIYRREEISGLLSASAPMGSGLLLSGDWLSWPLGVDVVEQKVWCSLSLHAGASWAWE